MGTEYTLQRSDKDAMPKYSEMGFGSGKAEEEVPGVLAAAIAFSSWFQVRYSAVSGKRIQMKKSKDKHDKASAINRSQLLHFLNAQHD